MGVYSEFRTAPQRTIRVVAETLGVDPATVTADSTLASLGADDMDALKVTEALSAEFTVPVPDADVFTTATPIRSIYNFFEARGA